MHSHAFVYAALMSNIAEFGANSNDVASCVFPMFHVSQHVVSMTFWVVGAAVHLDRSFDVDKFLRAVQSSRITFMVALPMMYGAILQSSAAIGIRSDQPPALHLRDGADVATHADAADQ